MIDVCKLLYEIIEDDRIYDLDFDLIDSGLLDSLSFIELFSSILFSLRGVSSLAGESRMSRTNTPF